MRGYASTALSGILALGLAAAEARAQLAVETVSGTATIAVPLPGTPIGPEIEFVGITIVTSLDFTPGSVTFEGQPVDFDGTEASFLASTYSGLALFPVNAGPATVTVTGVGAITGAVTVTGTALIQPVDLGPSFMLNRLDVLFPQAPISVDGTVFGWSSGVIPELNGESIDLEAEAGIINVDAVNGIVDLAFFGTIFAPSLPSVPSLPTWGLILLAAGILGMAVLLLRQRRSDHANTAA